MGEEEKPPEWAAKLLQGQARQGETLNGLGDAIEKQGDTLNGLGLSQAKLETTVDHIREQARDGRREDRETRVELEGKVKGVHDRVNDLDKVAGRFENHIEDDHATKAAETAKALDDHAKDGHADLAVKTAAEFTKHDVDNNRHSGEAPGGGGAVKTGATVAGGVTVGGGIIWGIVEVVKLFSG